MVDEHDGGYDIAPARYVVRQQEGQRGNSGGSGSNDGCCFQNAGPGAAFARDDDVRRVDKEEIDDDSGNSNEGGGNGSHNQR